MAAGKLNARSLGPGAGSQGAERRERLGEDSWSHFMLTDSELL